jgi:hypothetical protein
MFELSSVKVPRWYMVRLMSGHEASKVVYIKWDNNQFKNLVKNGSTVNDIVDSIEKEAISFAKTECGFIGKDEFVVVTDSKLIARLQKLM